MFFSASEEYIDESLQGHRASLYAEDIKPGAILLSNHDIIGHSSAFSQSVVLLFSHSEKNGSQGVILNQRILSRAESLESGCFSSSSDLITECTRAQHRHQEEEEDIAEPIHYFGGPTFALERLVVMHMFSNIPGSREILLAGDDEEREVLEMGVDAAEMGYPEKVYFGGLISDVLTQQRRPGSERKPIWIFHGIRYRFASSALPRVLYIRLSNMHRFCIYPLCSAWSKGQLIEEIDAGAWTVKPGTLDDLVFFSQIGTFDGPSHSN